MSSSLFHDLLCAVPLLSQLSLGLYCSEVHGPLKTAEEDVGCLNSTNNRSKRAGEAYGKPFAATYSPSRISTMVLLVGGTH